MIFLDKKDKEIHNMRELSKDNHRTIMIQELKSKINELELIIDVLKEDLMGLKDMNKEDMNEYVIRKSISGPKRFRPLLREELENKIIELEKAVLNYQYKIQNNNNISHGQVKNDIRRSIGTSIESRNRSRSTIDIDSYSDMLNAQAKNKSSKCSDSKLGVKSYQSQDDTESSFTVLKFIEIMDENISLKSQLSMKEGMIIAQREEIALLQNNCNEYAILGTSQDELRQEHADLVTSYDSLCAELG